MLTLARALQANSDGWNPRPSGLELTWSPFSVQFDATLVERLVDQYGELSKRFDALASQVGNTAAGATELAVEDCTKQLNQLRHIEALRIYPIIARGLSANPVARRLFWQSRIVMLGLARRVIRCFDEIRAMRNESGIAVAIDHATKVLAEYRRRNEAEIYPLYILAGQHALTGTQTA